jgi:hypothetical protein
MRTKSKRHQLPGGTTSISTETNIGASEVAVSLIAWKDERSGVLVDYTVAELPTQGRAETQQALVHLWRMAKGCSSSEKAAASFLLGLYNGYRFKFDLTDFRLFDSSNFRRCMLVLAMDHAPKAEVHVVLALALGRSEREVQSELEHLAYRNRFKGAVKKSELPASSVMESGVA